MITSLFFLAILLVGVPIGICLCLAGVVFILNSGSTVNDTLAGRSGKRPSSGSAVLWSAQSATQRPVARSCTHQPPDAVEVWMLRCQDRSRAGS